MSRDIVHTLRCGVMAMSISRVVILAVVLEGRSNSEVARDYGVSRRWVQKLVARYELEGEAAFEPHSRRPRSNPRRISAEFEEAIISRRKTLTGSGLGPGAETIAFHLGEAGFAAPSVATIWRILWVAVDHAMRRGEPLPTVAMLHALSWLLTGAAVAAAILVFVL